MEDVEGKSKKSKITTIDQKTNSDSGNTTAVKQSSKPRVLDQIIEERSPERTSKYIVNNSYRSTKTGLSNKIYNKNIFKESQHDVKVF